MESYSSLPESDKNIELKKMARVGKSTPKLGINHREYGQGELNVRKSLILLENKKKGNRTYPIGYN